VHLLPLDGPTVTEGSLEGRKHFDMHLLPLDGPTVTESSLKVRRH